MKICIRVGSETVFAYAEGQPGAGDVIIIPGSSFNPPREDVAVVVTTLHPTWRSDDDGALVPTFDATPR
jgi:hypothetical protein